MIGSPMPRLRLPTNAEFTRYVRTRTPVVIEGALVGWRAPSCWTHDRLKVLGAAVTARVQSRWSDRASDFEYKDVSFGDFIDSLREPAAQDYLASFPLLDRIPALWADLEVPPYAGALSVSPRVFIGPRGALSPLHYDLAHGLSAQVVGRKSVVVFELRRRDMVRHPDLRQPGWLSDALDAESGAGRSGVRALQRWHCTVSPGDLVFLPSRRHHLVRSLDDSISVSFFWHTATMQLTRWALGRLGRAVL
jgi:[protein]-arginine 3-hydroxylase / protease